SLLLISMTHTVSHSFPVYQSVGYLNPTLCPLFCISEFRLQFPEFSPAQLDFSSEQRPVPLILRPQRPRPFIPLPLQLFLQVPRIHSWSGLSAIVHSRSGISGAVGGEGGIV